MRNCYLCAGCRGMNQPDLKHENYCIVETYEKPKFCVMFLGKATWDKIPNTERCE